MAVELIRIWAIVTILHAGAAGAILLSLGVVYGN